MIKAKLKNYDKKTHCTTVTLNGERYKIAEEFCDIVESLIEPENFGKDGVEKLIQTIIDRYDLNVKPQKES